MAINAKQNCTSPQQEFVGQREKVFWDKKEEDRLPTTWEPKEGEHEVKASLGYRAKLRLARLTL